MISRTSIFNVLDEDQLISIRYSLEVDFEGVSGQISQELWHSLDLNKTIFVDIKVGPGILKVLSQKLCCGFWSMCVADLGRSILSSSLIEEEVSRWLSVLILHFNRVVLDKGPHKSIISLLSESGWNNSGVATLSFSVAIDWSESVDALNLNVFLVVRRGLALGELQLGPVIVEVAGEGAVRMGVFGHWASNVWLWVLLDASLNLGPVVVEVTREG